MKMKMLNAAAVVALSVLAGVASASEPAKTGDIGSANGKSVYCGVTTTRLDLNKIAIRSDIKVGDLGLASVPSTGDGIADTIIDLGGNERIKLSVTFSPTGSPADSGPLMIMSAMLFRVDSEGRKVALAQDISSSDEVNRVFAAMEEQSHKQIIHSEMRLSNIELITLASNQKVPSSVYGLLKAGLIPNGSLVEVSLGCHIRLNK